MSVIFCLLAAGLISPTFVYTTIKYALNDPLTVNILIIMSSLSILLAIRCIFFSTDKEKINGIKNGILLKNDDGELVISKTALEELVKNITKGFDSAQNVDTKIILDDEKNLIVYVTLSVKETAIIKELSNNLQTKIKSAIKKTSDLEVKEVNISVKELQADTKVEQ